MTEEEKKNLILKHQLEEWKYHNDYINKMDLGYQQTLILIVSIFACIATFVTQGDRDYIMGIFIVPFGLVAVFAYLSYQFRITAILRGHLANLEEKMNEAIGKDIHMWNSALVETYMAHNNMINNYMMLPILVFVALLVMYCVYFSWIALEGIENRIIYFFVYWFMVFVGIVIDLVPLFNNERVRREAKDEKKVKEMYQRYVNGIKNDKKAKEFKYENPNVNQKHQESKILINSFFLMLAICVMGLGVLEVFWIFSDKNTDLLGLYDYYAATIGDGLFLPVFAGAGFYYCKINKIKHWRIKPAIFTAIVALGIQISWLINPNIELNWTITRPHYFTYAGWYHAVYFVLMAALLSIIFINSININCKKNIKARLSYSLMWCAGFGYWHMHLLDDCLSKGNTIGWIVGSAIVCLLGYFIIEFIYGKWRQRINLVIILYVIITSILLWVFCINGGQELNLKDLIEIMKKI